MKLHTARTFLRRFELSDLQSMIQLESDPAVMRFTPSRVALDPVKIEERLKSLVEKQNQYEPLGVWAAFENRDQKFIGWFMLMKTEFNVPELGFMIVKDQWGKGYATEVAERLIVYCFAQLNHVGLAAVTDADNEASIHTLRKLGFRHIETRMKKDRVLNRDIEALIFELNK